MALCKILKGMIILKEKILYIAYATNLDTFQMEKNCPNAKIVGVGELMDFQLLFRGDHDNAYATIEPSKGDCVPVIVWEIEPQDELKLDNSVGYPNFYSKEIVTIQMYSNVYEMEKNHFTGGETISGMVYKMIETPRIAMPSSDYLNSILDGYDEAGFDPTAIENALEISQKYVENLLNREE